MTDWQLGLQAFREGRMREAADRLRASLADSEMTVSQLARYETCAYLGAALYSLGLPEEALPAFETAVQLSPAAFPADDLLMNLAHASLAAGRRDAAQAALQKLLSYSPGHVAASMLAARLDAAPAEETVTGAMLGTSPETSEQYIRTLTFSQSVAGGYAPAEVQEALHQLQRFIVGLSRSLREAEATIAQHELEILRYRQMEDAVIENMMQAPSHAPAQARTLQGPEDEPGRELSPIEMLFRQQSSA